MDIAEILRTEFDLGVANLKHKSFQENVNDLSINAKYQFQLLKEVGNFSRRHGVSEITKNMKRYPWLKEFVINLEFLYFKLVHRRTGEYREANAMVAKLLLQVMEELLDGVFTHPDKVVLHEDMVPPEILMAMGLKPWMGEFGGMVMPLVFPPIAEAYIDAAENEGIAPDTCSLPKTTMGMTLMKHMPTPVAIVASNLPCDSGMASYTVMERELQAPAFRLDIPHNFKNERARTYFVGELKRMITWLEEKTPGRMDWDRLREICEMRNQAKELELELWEMLRERPAPMAGEPIIFGHLITSQFFPGYALSIEYFKKLLKLATQLRERGQGALKEERFRALMWNPTTPSFSDLYNWTESTYGIAFIMDMMSFQRHGFIDTATPDSMLDGLAQIIMEGPMARHTRGPSENFFSDLFHIYEHFDLDMIFMAEHVGCKNTKALNGIFREQCRKRNIPLFFLQYDLCDSRISHPSSMKRQIEEFMETIMKAERLDR
ncbi:2-hydroxyacyl-CoA dehydratase family protein [Deltaproteobacteria bacterium TL4]